MGKKENANGQNWWFHFLEALRKRAFWVRPDDISLKPGERMVYNGVQGGKRR